MPWSIPWCTWAQGSSFLSSSFWVADLIEDEKRTTSCFVEEVKKNEQNAPPPSLTMTFVGSGGMKTLYTRRASPGGGHNTGVRRA